ncbi:hypothetical protein ACU8KH_00015 [Lachancea thermotolerans]
MATMVDKKAKTRPLDAANAAFDESKHVCKMVANEAQVGKQTSSRRHRRLKMPGRPPSWSSDSSVSSRSSNSCLKGLDTTGYQVSACYHKKSISGCNSSSKLKDFVKKFCDLLSDSKTVCSDNLHQGVPKDISQLEGGDCSVNGQ